MKGHIIRKVAVACFFSSLLPCSAWSPTDAFKEAFVPALDRFERAIITTNWKGFILRSDRQSQVDKQLPSQSGLYLNVMTRIHDALPAKLDETVKDGLLTTRTTAFPPVDPKVDEDGYLVIFTYGPGADAEAVAAIHKAIDAMRKMPEAYHAEKGAKLPITAEK